MFLDVTDYSYEDLQDLYTAGVLYFTLRGGGAHRLFAYPNVATSRPYFHTRIGSLGQRFYIRLEE